MTRAERSKSAIDFGRRALEGMGPDTVERIIKIGEAANFFV
jgi:hypothetical protein